VWGDMCCVSGYCVWGDTYGVVGNYVWGNLFSFMLLCVRRDVCICRVLLVGEKFGVLGF